MSAEPEATPEPEVARPGDRKPWRRNASRGGGPQRVTTRREDHRGQVLVVMTHLETLARAKALAARPDWTGEVLRFRPTWFRRGVGDISADGVWPYVETTGDRHGSFPGVIVSREVPDAAAG